MKCPDTAPELQASAGDTVVVSDSAAGVNIRFPILFRCVVCFVLCRPVLCGDSSSESGRDAHAWAQEHSSVVAPWADGGQTPGDGAGREKN